MASSHPKATEKLETYPSSEEEENVQIGYASDDGLGDDAAWGEEEGDRADDAEWDDTEETVVPVHIQQDSVEAGDILESAPFLVLSVSELEQQMHALICDVCTALKWERDDAVIALRHFRWSSATLLSEVKDKGLEETRKGAGLPSVPQAQSFRASSQPCLLCDDTTRCFAVGCDHSMCWDCWKGWVSAALEKGPAVLSTRCPAAAGCTLVLPLTFIKQLLHTNQHQNLARWNLESFVECNRDTLGWCPAPNCSRALKIGSSIAALGIRCKCGYEGCFACAKEDHSPATCHEYEKWMEGILKDAGASDYILANTKGCPNCKVNIEKNQGCDHMTCARCKHEFCWLCFGNWRGHNVCNRFADKQTPESKAGSTDAESVRVRLERYVHFADRWRNHLKATAFANRSRADLAYKVGDMDMALFQDIIAAIDEVVLCRRVLAWTYVYAFYVAAKDGATQRLLFENHQECLETYTGKLHELAEKSFASLRTQDVHSQIVRLTSLLTKYRANINRNIKEHPLPTTLQDDSDTFRKPNSGEAALDPKSLSIRRAVMENLKSKPGSKHNKSATAKKSKR